MTNNNGRNSNFEVIRLLAILMITAYHYVVHGVQDPVGGGNLLYCSSLWGKAGVNLFCLLTGYMLIGKDEIKYSRLKTVEGQVLFYTLSGLLVGFILHKYIGPGVIYYSVLPVISGHYWYITAYFIVFLLSPYINKLLQSIEKQSFKRLLLVCYVVWCIIPFFTLRENDGLFWNQFIWFVVMYMTGAYLKLYDSIFSRRTYIYAELAANLLLISSVFAIEWLAGIKEEATPFITYFRWSNSPLIVIICVGMMRLASMAPFRSIGWINFLASLVLGIYLFQENKFYQDILWHDLFNNSVPTTDFARFLHLIGSVLGVVIIGGIIEFIRVKIFKIIRITK